MTPHSPLLSVHNLSVHIGDVPIVRDVSFQVSDGEILAIIGPNGAGKTTLLKTLLGFRSGYTGRIVLNDRPIETYSAKERARWMAYVPQQHEFADFSTVEEFIRMGRYPHLSLFRQSTEADHQAVQTAMALTHTEALAHRMLDTLSGGEQQKVLIAAALAQQPKLLLLDEPATFLDPKNQVEIHRLLKQINWDTGTTVVAITHDINSALQSSDRILALKAGRVAFWGTPAELVQPDLLDMIYDIPFDRIPISDTRCPLIFPAYGEPGDCL